MPSCMSNLELGDENALNFSTGYSSSNKQVSKIAMKLTIRGSTISVYG